MSRLDELRKSIHVHKKDAAGQRPKRFLPTNALYQILQDADILETLRDTSFNIKPHKLESTVDFVATEGSIIFAILIDLGLERTLTKFIEYGICDNALPVSEKQLDPFLEPRSEQFVQRQWQYLAYSISTREYARRLNAECILPYVSQQKLGGSGFSDVYEVFVHPAHQDIDAGTKGEPLRLVRKEIKDVNPSFTQEEESEMLFLLRKLKHRNIVKLLATYVHDGIYNLLFWPADMDLHDFLLLPIRPTIFGEDVSIIKAVQGLCSGLRHLHYFKLSGTRVPEASAQLCGVHQDIKPRNVLVRGSDFILADFGLSRLKSIEEGSKTTFKDATYEYGAPECRDELTWAQGWLGRSSDVWSFGCIVSEVLIYMRNGWAGLQDFRTARVTQDSYGKQRAFHDGTRLKAQVWEKLVEVEESAKSPAISGIFMLLEKIFEEQSIQRPDSKEMECRLERIVLQTHIQDLLDAITKLRTGTRTHLFQATLSLESARFQAWAFALCLISMRRHSVDYTAQLPASFSELCDTLESAIGDMKSSLLFEPEALNETFILSALRQCNDSLYQHLPQAMKDKANGLFPILFTTNTKPLSLVPLSSTMVQTLPDYENTCRIAATKHMSSLYSEGFEDFGGSVKLEHFPVEKDLLFNNWQEHPRIYWYEEVGIAQEVLVEWREYGKYLGLNLTHDEVQQQVEPMFCRIQGLVRMLRKPKSENIRMLDCIGTFHNSNKQSFGIVFRFPKPHSTPVRLHYLLKGGGSIGIYQPHIGLKFAIAKNLAVCLRDVHLSGWVHKDMNSYNILFFRTASQPREQEYRMPILIGFQYSREDTENAFTLGPDSSDEMKQYQHPEYRDGPTPFRREFDYYSLGLVLLEIGLWECLSSVYRRRLMSTAWELKDEYLRLCDRRVLERMGPIYHAVTMRCLRAEIELTGAEIDVAMTFQRNIIDELESCNV